MDKQEYEVVGISQLPIGEVAGYGKFLEETGIGEPRFIRFIDTVCDYRSGERHELVKLKPYLGIVNE